MKEKFDTAIWMALSSFAISRRKIGDTKRGSEVQKEYFFNLDEITSWLNNEIKDGWVKNRLFNFFFNITGVT